jgi:hypothetical protein
MGSVWLPKPPFTALAMLDDDQEIARPRIQPDRTQEIDMPPGKAAHHFPFVLRLPALAIRTARGNQCLVWRAFIAFVSGG